MTALLAEMPVRFGAPVWLLLLTMLIPTLLLSLRSIGAISRLKAYITFGLRAVVICALVFAMADPYWVKKGEGLTVTVLLDRSDSIPGTLKRTSLEFLRRAADEKENQEDRIAVIAIAREPVINALADSYSVVDVTSEPSESDRKATNLAEGVRLALAIMPNDTINRIVLASDGNETMDSVLAAAELARANHVPIDVLLLEYDHEREVIFDQIIAPPRAREGQTARVRMMLRSQSPASGLLRLSLNGEPLDLNGDELGNALPVTLDSGITAFEQLISLDESGPHQFEGVFQPDDPSMDAIDRNNRALAVTFVGGRGRVLVIDDGEIASRYLVQALRESGVAVDVEPPDAWTGGLVFLSAYDAVVLANVPIYAFEREQDRMLHAYVHDLGGGLIMLGGDRSFGAGGWIDSETAKTLPVECNPPQTRQMPAGALALIMHSCEMPQGNFWGQQVAQSAIKALSRLDYVGIVEFNWGGGGGGGIQGCTWAFPMQRLGDKSAALDSTKTMQVGDMPSFAPSMQLALQGLQGVPAAQRHAIIISDGDPSPPSGALLGKYTQAGVTVTTVMVGGHGTGADRNKMQQVAQTTGGRFYNVTNPKTLPQIFFKEASLISRSLIQEGNVYPATVTSGLPGPTSGFSAVPAVDGYVLTAAREGLAQTPIGISTEEAMDPLLAHWNYGLGRSLAFTSDISGKWGSRWASWANFRSFWEQAVRWSMRPSSPTHMHVSTRIEGDVAIVEVEALEADASFLNFMRTSAVVIRPDSDSEILPLQQVGPGRYRGQFKTDTAGAYLINIVHETGAGDAKEKGSIQAAVNVPYPREFRAVKHNAALLRTLAESTGGRMIQGNLAPELADLFNSDSLEVPRSPKPIWDIIAIIAAAMLLIDVAARRVSVTREGLTKLFGRAVGKRAEATDDTMQAWKRARSSVAHRKPEPDERRSVRFEADEDGGDPTMDVAGESSGSVRDVSSSTDAGPDRRAAPEPEEEDDGEGYTSRLLAAKRRARRQDEEGDHE